MARLAVIGVRALDRLLAAYRTAGRDARVGILRALEAIADPRAVTVARRALADGGDVAVAATGPLRALLDSQNNQAATEALDALVGTALDPAADHRLRLAAFDALREMPASVRDPVSAALEGRPGQSRAGSASVEIARDAVWDDAIEGRLPDDPGSLREAIQARASHAPLGVLQKLIDAARAREVESATATQRTSWLGVRGTLHQALALRRSRVALYDLRETLAGSQEPLPSSFLAALHAVGDESCLEAIGAAWSAAGEPVHAGWRHQLQAAFDAIVKREKITRRSGVMKRIHARWPGLESRPT